ncbi:MAG: SPOR domain-containing protein, partial [Steroidobacteraceae bacterium]
GLARAAAWKSAQADNTQAALQGFLQKYPQGAEADQARAQLEQLNDSRAELGAFRSKAEAQKAQVKLQARFGTQLHGIVILPPAGADKRTRVASAPMSSQDAQAACATLKKEHQHCEVVKR